MKIISNLSYMGFAILLLFSCKKASELKLNICLIIRYILAS